MNPHPGAPRLPSKQNGSGTPPPWLGSAPPSHAPLFLLCDSLRLRTESLTKPLSDVESGHGRQARLLSASSRYPASPAREAPGRCVERTGARHGQCAQRSAHRNAGLDEHHRVMLLSFCKSLVCVYLTFGGGGFAHDPCTVKMIDSI